jgi:hypothetical protein
VSRHSIGPLARAGPLTDAANVAFYDEFVSEMLPATRLSARRLAFANKV